MSTIDDPTGGHLGGLGAHRDHGGGGAAGDEEYDSDYGDDDFDDEQGTEPFFVTFSGCFVMRSLYA